jgi:hypothetical protein
VTQIETVQEIYAAFGRGDIPRILSLVSDDVEWEYGVNSTDVPWLQPRRGRAGAAAFFQSLAGFDIQRFGVDNLCEAGKTVIALVHLEAVVRATGRRVIEEDEVHIWHFDDAGTIVRFRHRVDTHQHWAAFHGK